MEIGLSQRAIESIGQTIRVNPENPC